MTPPDLIQFEEEIVELFEQKQILAPIHLYNGNEQEMIDIFKYVQEKDWVFCTWRSHYQCLLKGVPPELIKKRILEGKSITLSFPDYKIYSSAIVGGIIPIALGAALENKRKGNNETIWVFVGDMTAETGIFHECYKYAEGFDLPIKFVVENNGKSVCTPTRLVWGDGNTEINQSVFGSVQEQIEYNNRRIDYYYESKYPHAGGLKRVQF